MNKSGYGDLVIAYKAENKIKTLKSSDTHTQPHTDGRLMQSKPYKSYLIESEISEFTFNLNKNPLKQHKNINEYKLQFG